MAELRKDMKPTLRIFAISFGVLGALYVGAAGSAQKPGVVLPQVVHTDVPYYPPLARAAHLEGAVRVRVTTDGLKVVVVHVEDGPKLLQEATEKTVQSWEFFKHEPTSFEVTFNYKLADDIHPNLNGPTVVLRLPTEVEIATTTLVISDPPAEIGHAKPISLVHESGHVTPPKEQ
jgi:hypothetical protein